MFICTMYAHAGYLNLNKYFTFYDIYGYVRIDIMFYTYLQVKM